MKTFLLILSLFSLCLWSIINYKIRKYIYPANLIHQPWLNFMNISRGDIVHQITAFSKFLFYFDIFVFVLLLRAPCFWEKTSKSSVYLKKMFSERKLLRASSLRQSHRYPTRFPIPLFDRHSLPHQLMVREETL